MKSSGILRRTLREKARLRKLILMCPSPPASVGTKLVSLVDRLRSAAKDLPALSSPAKIQNVVATFDTGRSVDLALLVRKAILSGTYAEYEPEVFSGIIVHPWKDRITVLLYASGKGVISGARSDEEISNAVSWSKNLVGGP